MYALEYRFIALFSDADNAHQNGASQTVHDPIYLVGDVGRRIKDRAGTHRTIDRVNIDWGKKLSKAGAGRILESLMRKKDEACFMECRVDGLDILALQTISQDHEKTLLSDVQSWIWYNALGILIETANNRKEHPMKLCRILLGTGGLQDPQPFTGVATVEKDERQEENMLSRRHTQK